MEKINNICIFIFISLPLLLISGPFFPDFVVTLSVVFFIFNFKKIYKISKINNIIIYFLLFYFYILILSLLSIDRLNSLHSSLFYFRFTIYSLVIFYFLTFYFQKIINFLFILFVIIFSSLFLDSLIQFFFKQNILGFEYTNNRVSSFFAEEKKLGGYLSRILPIAIGITFYTNLKFIKNINKSLIINFFLLSSLICIILSGERTAFLIFLFQFLIILLIHKKLNLNITYLIISAVIIISLSSIYNDAFFQRIFIKTYNQIFVTSDLHSITNTYFNYFYTSIRIFLDNIFGIGPNLYKYYCNELNNTLNCLRHPHHIYFQLLSETGIIGISMLLIFLIYISKNLFSIILKQQYQNFDYLYLFSSFSILINIFPFYPHGNIFNNWYSILIYYPLAFFMYSKFKINEKK